MSIREDGDIWCNGNLTARSFSPPAGCIGDAAVAAAAGIKATKLQHQYRPHYAQPNTTATTETKAVYVVYGASGTLLDFRAGSIGVCAGAATVTVDLRKNGTSALAAPVTLSSSASPRVAAAAVLNPASVALAAGDELEVVVTATAGGGTPGTGVFALVTLVEDAQ